MKVSYLHPDCPFQFHIDSNNSLIRERMIPINNQLKKRVVIYVCDTDGKGTYPLRRAKTIAQALPKSIEITIVGPERLKASLTNFTFIPIGNSRELLTILKKASPDLLLRDSGSTSREEVEKIKKIVPSVIHFDDFGDGGELADFVIQTLYTETTEKHSAHYIVGPETFIADKEIAPYKAIGLHKKESHKLPHLIVTFGDEDPGNLTYRALRHLVHLQVPLKITILIGDNYKHDLVDLRMMALSRRNTTVLQQTKNTAELLSTADIVLCASGYFPYEIGVMGIPCIVLAQNEFESTLDFPTERNGFIHLGLGRKVKQSMLLNAVMEFLLHDSLRKKTIQRQMKLNLGNGQSIISEAILYCLEHRKRETKHKGPGKETSDMI